MTTKTESTFCRVCHASCPMEVDVVDNRAVAVRGIADDPLFEGYTCIKGRQLPDQMADPGRLRRPLRRRDDDTPRHDDIFERGRTFEELSSADALDAIAVELRRIIDTHGPRAVASYTGTGGYQNSLGVPAARAFHKGIGSTSFYTSLTIDQPAKATAPFRLGVWEAGYHNFRGADVLLAIGYNPMVSSYGPVGGLQGTNPFTVMRRRKAAGTKLIVVDPRRTELAAFADVHLQIRPGEDPTLLAGMINLVLNEQLHDQEFCERWVDQLDPLGSAVAPFTIDRVAERCELDADDIVTATRMFAAGERGTAGTGTGPNMAPHPSLTEHLAMVLNTVCGRVNRPGDTIESGALLYPDLPRRAQVIPAREPARGPHARARGLRGYAGEMPSSSLAEEILTPGEGRIRALIVSGGNPAVAFPDQELTLRALADLELLVVIDHRMTATAEFANYVLAPTLSLERADVPHLMDRWFGAPYSNYTDAVLERDGDVLNEWEVFWELARRLGTTLPLSGGSPDMTVRPTDDEMIERAYANSRLPIPTVRASRGVVHPDMTIVVQEADADATGRFTPAPDDLMAELSAVFAESGASSAPAGPDPVEYPYRLISRRMKHVLNSLGAELPGLAAKGSTNPAFMHPDDVTALGVDAGDIVEIRSPRSSVLAVVQPAEDVKRGVVSMAHSWGGSSLSDEKVRDIGSPTSRLVSVDAEFDPVTGMVVQSAIPVAITPSEAPA